MIMIYFDCNYCGTEYELELERGSYMSSFYIKDPAIKDKYSRVTVDLEGKDPCPKCKKEIERSREDRLREIQIKNGLYKEPKKKRGLFR